jgi:hypothetical protein
MRVTIFVGLLVVFGGAARGKGTDRQVQRGSELERELGYKLSVHDKHDEWRSQGFDEVFPIEGTAPEYVVKFRATAVGKLEDLSGPYTDCEAFRRDRGAGPSGDQIDMEQRE